MNSTPLPRAPRYVPEPRSGPLALLVSDSAGDIARCQEVLRGAGFRTAVRRQGDEAMHLLEEVPADLLVLGQWEGRLDGLTLLRILRQTRPELVAAAIAVGCASDAALQRMIAQEGVTAFACGELTGDALVEALHGLQEEGQVPRPTPPMPKGDLLSAVLGPDPDAPDHAANDDLVSIPALVLGSTWNGRFTIDRVLGRGATSVVYGVRDQVLGNELALKLLTRPARGDNAVERFRREVRISRDVVHPNLVRTFDFGVEIGRPWYTMEWLRGSTLEGRLAAGPVEPGIALGMMAQAFSGLAALHEAGVIHRDIKPENLHITPKGRVCLMDFGISRWGGEAAALTQTGVVLGSPMYMAPEVLAGEADASPASDIWALGIVCYETLTRRHPYARDSLADFILAATTQRPRPPSTLRPVLNCRVDGEVLDLLARDPGARSLDCSEIAASLRRMAIAHGCPKAYLPL